MKITVEVVRNFNPNPCYDPTKVVPENWTGTALDVLNLPISADDRLWVVLRKEILSEATLYEFARWCALQVIHLWDAPGVVRKYLTGDETLRVAAWDAAQDASRAAGRAAAWAASAAAADAARAAALAAARAAAWDASAVAADAARATALAVARAAARAASRDAQVEKLKEMIGK